VPVTIDERGAISTVQLEGEVDIGSAQQLKAILLDALGSRKPLRVELASSASLDITILQLLWAARLAAAKSCTELVIAEPIPEQIARTMIHAGLGKLLVEPI
jgi:anti-anti-sigma regulatory factor